MNILAIDTTSAIASCAVMSHDGEIREVHNEQKMSHLQNLMPMIDELLKKCKLQISDITHIAVSEGPGSFTGIRIGAATGKMLAQILDVPMIAVPSLMTYAYAFKESHGEHINEYIVCPMLDARRSQVYAAAYRWQKDLLEEVVKGDAYTVEEFCHGLDGSVKRCFIGDGARVYKDEIIDLSRSDQPIMLGGNTGENGLARYVCQIGFEKLQRGETINHFEFKPVYMRKAEAERKLEEGPLKPAEGI